MLKTFVCHVLLISGFAVAAENGQELRIYPRRLGIMGFSTGGQLTAMTSHRFDAGKNGASDEVERQSSRPDFTILIYPANVRTVGEISKDAPPAFLLCTYGDNNPA